MKFLLTWNGEVSIPFGLSLSKPVPSLPKWPVHLSTGSGRTDFKLHLAQSIIALFGLLLASLPAHANPFPKGDARIGKTLHDKSCTGCHVSMVGGDGSVLYSRLERKVKTPQQLQGRIRTCNTNVGANWFPEEENHVAAYLNNTYYHFK